MKKEKREFLISLRVEKEIFTTLEKYAEENEQTTSSIVRRAIKEFFRKRELIK